MVDEKPKTLFLLLPVSCTNENLDERPNYAVIEVDQALISQMLGQIARVKRYQKEEDEHILEFRSWDASPTWFKSFAQEWLEEDHKDLFTGEGDVQDLLDSGNMALLEAMPKFDEDCSGNRTDCESRIVRVDEVRWKAGPKNTSDYVDTAAVEIDTWKAIRKLLKAKE